MIESIALESFYCFNKRTEVSFVAGRERSRSMDEMYSGFNEQNRVNLLKMVYLYGNNGAGKSKLLMAFDTLKELVTELPDEKMKEGRELKKVILALLKSIGSNIVNFEKIPLPKRLPQRFSSHFKAIPFGQADSQFKSLKFKVVGQADGTPQGLRLKNYSAVKEKSCIFAAE